MRAMTIMTIIISMAAGLSEAKGKKTRGRSSDLGVICSDAAEREICTAEMERRVLDIVYPTPRSGKDSKIEMNETTMSYYADLFDNRKSASGNCFSQKDPTVAVNQGREDDIGKIVKVAYGGRTRFVLVTDTGKMSTKERSRDLDASKGLFTAVIGSTGPGTARVSWARLGKIDDRRSFETAIACLKKINSYEAITSDANASSSTSTSTSKPSSRPNTYRPPASQDPDEKDDHLIEGLF